MPAASEEVLATLNERERRAYKSWCDSGDPQLAPSLNAKLFDLYLRGHCCEEIARLNNPHLKLGQVVAARVEGDWDLRRKEHLDRLLTSTSERVQQATMETAEFVCDLLAVANREHGDRLRRYLQSGDPKELGDFKITSLFGLKQAIEVLQKLAGQEHAAGKVPEVPAQPARPQSAAPPTPQEAAKVLKLLNNKEN